MVGELLLDQMLVPERRDHRVGLRWSVTGKSPFLQP
jgi:hypothetical protein